MDLLNDYHEKLKLEPFTTDGWNRTMLPTSLTSRLAPWTGLVLFLLLGTPLPAAEQPWQELFNGKDLSGWEGAPGIWSVEAGAITGQTTAAKPLTHNTFLVWTAGKVDNFELKLEYRFQSEHGNSGIQYRSHLDDSQKFIVGGYQADMETGPNYTGILYEERGRGILAQRGQRLTLDPQGQRAVESFADTAALQKVIKAQDWNQYIVLAEGPRLRHYVNGKLMSETIDHELKKRAVSGILALQVHQGPPMKVQFRKLKLRRIPSTSRAGSSEKQSPTAPR